MCGKIVINIKILTEISEHARQSGEREISGYLIGKRNSDKSISEISHYEPLLLGGEGITSVDTQSLITIINALDNTEEKIVGFAHSHPYKGAPSYSREDKETHVKISFSISIFEYLSPLYTFIPKDFLIKLSIFLSQFNFYQIKYLLEIINSTIHNLPIFEEIKNTLLQYNPDSWSILESEIKSIVNKYQIKTVPIPLNLIPQAGMVICPWRRQIGILDCIYENNPQDPNLPVKEWFYYRIAIKKE